MTPTTSTSFLLVSIQAVAWVQANVPFYSRGELANALSNAVGLTADLAIQTLAMEVLDG